MSASDILDNVAKAQIAEHAERFDDMAKYMKALVESGNELTYEQRHLLSVAYKNVVGERRSSWRIINSLSLNPDYGFNISHCNGYKMQIEQELKDLCGEVLNLLDQYLIPLCTDLDSKVFYKKMKGDYYRYLAEVLSSADEKKQAISNAEKSYQDAAETVDERDPETDELVLKVTSPIRLGLALNFSVFFYEILDKREEACKMAKDAFDAAINELGELDQSDYKDATLIMQLLRDNMTLWNQELERSEEQEVDGEAAKE